MKKRGKSKRSKKGGKKSKRAQMHFAWIFAIIVGAFILFLTFFFLSRQIFVQELEQETEQIHGLDILLGPFSYLGAIAETTSNQITLFEITNLGFDCNEQGLGYNTIITEKTSHDIHDKYIFAQDMETKNIIAISKPFKMPFRIADLIYLAKESSAEEKIYCFVNAPLMIENELSNLEIKGFEFYNSLSQCSQETTSICFDVSAPCDIKIYDRSTGSFSEYEIGEVRKGQEKMNFAGRELLYAAMFSSEEIYECNLNRLSTRIDYLITVYREKAIALNRAGCDENYNTALTMLENAASSLDPNNLNSLITFYNAAQQIDNLNTGATCSLF
jgi:hypothetical protein